MRVYDDPLPMKAFAAHHESNESTAARLRRTEVMPGHCTIYASASLKRAGRTKFAFGLSIFAGSFAGRTSELHAEILLDRFSLLPLLCGGAALCAVPARGLDDAIKLRQRVRAGRGLPLPVALQ